MVFKKGLIMSLSIGNSNFGVSNSNKVAFGMKAKPIDVVATVSGIRPADLFITSVNDICTAVSGKSARRLGLADTEPLTVQKLTETFPALKGLSERLSASGMSSYRNIKDQLAWLDNTTKSIFGDVKEIDVPEVVGGEVDTEPFRSAWDDFLKSLSKNH